MLDIEERLKGHSSALNSLLSLIPADKYYEMDQSFQWNRRKQTKEDHKNAKMAKLNPEGRAGMTVCDVAHQHQTESDQHEFNRCSAEVESQAALPLVKYQNVQRDQDFQMGIIKKRLNGDTNPKHYVVKTTETGDVRKVHPEKLNAKDEAPYTEHGFNQYMLNSEKCRENDNVHNYESSRIGLPSPIVSDPDITGSSRISIDCILKHEQRLRIIQRIDALRAKRMANNPDGSPIRNRQELINARRKNDAARKKRKSEYRLQSQNLEEANIQGCSNGIEDINKAGCKLDKMDETISFGRVIFDDGQQLNHSLKGFEKGNYQRGPTDIVGQLKLVEAKSRRVENMTDAQKDIIEEKDKWFKALKRATGERIRDDKRLLKKALKRQEKSKQKSEKKWKERIVMVNKTKAKKAKKREENTRARKHPKKDAGKGRKPRATIEKAGKSCRAGFEGRMQSNNSRTYQQ